MSIVVSAASLLSDAFFAQGRVVDAEALGNVARDIAEAVAVGSATQLGSGAAASAHPSPLVEAVRKMLPALLPVPDSSAKNFAITFSLIPPVLFPRILS